MNLNPKQTIDLKSMSKFSSGIRSLDYSHKTKRFVIGTRSAEVIELGLDGSYIQHIVHGHFEGEKQAELWGCAVHPTK